MRNVALIMRRELAAWISGPAGYLVGALFLFLDGLFFNTLAVGTEPRLSSDVLHIFFWISNLVILIAAVLLSIRLLAEDYSLGTRVLLFTSPVREGEMVLGKYLSSLVVVTFLIFLSLHLPLLVLVHGKISWGHIAMGYAGMFLTGASGLAIGMLASSISSTVVPSSYSSFAPFLAVLLAAAMCALLCLGPKIGELSDEPISSILAYVPLWFPLSSRPFARGLFQLSDFVFYLTIIYVSLIAATRVLTWQRWR